MRFSETYAQAEKAVADGKTSELLRLSEKLINSDYEPAHPAGYMLKGMAYELGGDGIDQNFEKAVSCYRKSAYLEPTAFAYVAMARATMKKGPEANALALKYLHEAENTKYIPEIDIAYGMCYENFPEPNFDLAKEHYTKAALHGRFHGFFGYSAISRKMGQNGRALLVDCIRVILSPFIFLVFGKSASSGI